MVTATRTVNLLPSLASNGYRALAERLSVFQAETDGSTVAAIRAVNAWGRRKPAMSTLRALAESILALASSGAEGE
jgi:hypothetical protein